MSKGEVFEALGGIAISLAKNATRWYNNRAQGGATMADKPKKPTIRERIRAGKKKASKYLDKKLAGTAVGNWRMKRRFKKQTKKELEQRRTAQGQSNQTSMARAARAGLANAQSMGRAGKPKVGTLRQRATGAARNAGRAIKRTPAQVAAGLRNLRKAWSARRNRSTSANKGTNV